MRAHRTRGSVCIHFNKAGEFRGNEWVVIPMSHVEKLECASKLPFERKVHVPFERKENLPFGNGNELNGKELQAPSHRLFPKTLSSHQRRSLRLLNSQRRRISPPRRRRNYLNGSQARSTAIIKRLPSPPLLKPRLGSMT